MAAGDEDTMKKDTDCVYFLASPLTCKKGNDCEFRHSENARLNPRDCWYWLQGKCLNRDCAFRHPPVEGRTAPLPPPSTLPTSASTSKTPCYYYSQGYCAKGDRCTFLHGKSPVISLPISASQKPTSVSVKGSIEPQDKRSAKTEVATRSANTEVATATLNVKLTSTLAKANSQLTKPSNVWRLSADTQTQVSSAPDSRFIKTDMSKSLSPNGGGHRQSYKRSFNISGKDLVVREENSGPKSNATWLRKEPMLLGKEQNVSEHQEKLKMSNNRIDSIVNGPKASFHPKDFLLSENEDTMQDLSTGRHMSRQVTNPVGNRTADYSENPGISEGRADFDTRVVYDGGGSDQKNEQQHVYAHASHNRLQGIQYSDGMDCSVQGFTQDKPRTQQVYRERKESVERKGRVSSGAHDLRNHIVKRRRLDEAEPSLENLSRVHVSEKFLNNVKQSRQQPHADYSDEAYEKRLDTRPSSRQSFEMDISEGDKILRRASHYVSDSNKEEMVQKAASKNLSRLPGAYEYLKSGNGGLDDVKVPMLDSDTSAVSERLPSMSHSRKNEVRKEISDFAGPKSLAQIKAEKENIEAGKEVGLGVSDYQHSKSHEATKSKIQVKPSIGTPHSEEESFLVNGEMLRDYDDATTKVPMARLENGKQNTTLKKGAFADEHSTRQFVKDPATDNSQGKVACISHEFLESEAEYGNMTSLKVRASVNNGSGLPAFHGKMHDGNVFQGENLEEFYGKPGDESAMAEEEEDDDEFARKLGGYFS